MPDFLKIVALSALLVLSSKPIIAGDQDTVAPVVFDCWEPERIFKQCAATGADGRPRLKPSYLARLRYDRDGLASVLLMDRTDTRKGQWFYVRRGVIPMPVEFMDNGPDYFKDGLARSRVGGKIGYIDRKLNLVIPATYDGAYPFEDGVAVVCTACTIAGDGEHSWYEGGQWGRIDRKGRVVSPFRPWEKARRLEFD
ncbi:MULTISPECIES: WG repeat-containing protein [unclassified Bradyrhizobium]|uniref:WG repeat-containing protein n=1 Tax=unclassified Bradyrhizobium TaxID=2631580 RepID=UPI002FF1CB54